MRKTFAVILLAFFGSALLSVHALAEDFSGGECFGTVISESTGYIELADEKTVGTYTSAEITTDPFRYMVLSWNTDTPKGTMLRIEAKVRVNDAWSEWLFIGMWSTSGDKSSAGPLDMSDDGIAFVDVDTITVKGDNGEIADAYAYRLSLFSMEQGVSPSVRMIAATFRNDLPGQEIERKIVLPIDELDAFTGTLDVIPFAQTTRDPQFARVICSPVSAAMVLDYHGISILPEMAAMGVFDMAYDGYGNWAFNAAFIGSCGLESYVKYCADLNDLKMEIMAGNPVICSIRYRQSDKINRNLPIIDAAPIEYTSGHLIVVVGYEKINGKSYVVVNDPAAGTEDEVRRYYEESQFIEAWAAAGKVAYITHKLESGVQVPYVTDALLAPTGGAMEQDGVLLREYSIKIPPFEMMISAAKNVGSEGEKVQSGVSIVVWDDALSEIHSYIEPTDDSDIWLTQEQSERTVYVFFGTGENYRASVRR